MEKVKSYNTENYNSITAIRLRELVGDRTIKSVAKEIGITRQSLAKYLDGSTSPKADTLSVLAEYFGVTSDYLLGENNSVEKNMEVFMCNTGMSLETINVLLGLNQGTQPLFGDTKKTKKMVVFEQIVTNPQFLPLLDFIYDYVYSKHNEDKDFDLFKLKRYFIKIIDDISKGVK